MFSAYLGESILKKAQVAGHLTIQIHNIRDWAVDKHRVTDEPPFGGGGGMVLKPEPIFSAIDAIRANDVNAGIPQPKIIYLSPQGRPFTHAVASELVKESWLLLLCGRYEGIDERVAAHLIDDEISIGDFVLTGGELPAMVLIDAVARLIPGVLGDASAAEQDSLASGLLEGPHYTRPEVYRGWSVPSLLRSGHAGKIRRWRREQALRRTWQRRPDLLLTAALDEDDRRFLMDLALETLEEMDDRSFG